MGYGDHVSPRPLGTDDHDDGGPAFPLHPEAQDFTGEPYNGMTGMSLRDYFADGAMRSYCHPDSISRILHQAGLTTEEVEDRIASRAFKMADAMINERKKAHG